VIITGGNTGLGFKTAGHIATNESFHIILACRSLEKANEAAQTLTKGLHKRIGAMQLDLGSLSSIRQFANEFKERKDLPPLGVILCNAGLQMVNDSLTEDGFETTFGVNHLGHFLLVNLLLELEPSRIIFVSSGTHDPAQKTSIEVPIYKTAKLLAHPEAPTEAAFARGRRAYSTSKLCNILCTYELDRKLKQIGKNITVNAFDPGLMIGTGLARDYPKWMNFAWNHILPLFSRFMSHARDINVSSAALAKLAIDTKFDGVTGQYFTGYDHIKSSVDSYDEDKAKDLWDTSVELVKLQPSETIFKI